MIYSNRTDFIGSTVTPDMQVQAAASPAHQTFHIRYYSIPRGRSFAQDRIPADDRSRSIDQFDRRGHSCDYEGLKPQPFNSEKAAA